MPKEASPSDAMRLQVVMEAIHALRQVQAEMHRVLASLPNQDISIADMLVLHQVAHGEGVTPGQIVAATGLTSGGVTNLIDRLEQKGLVTRRRSTEDRRVVLVSLAPKAHQDMASMMGIAHAEVARMFEGWSASRIQTFVDLLNDLNRGRERR